MSEQPANLDFQVRKDDFHETQVVEAPAPAAPQPGQVILRVDSFAFTANNITYAAYGDILGYWQFYPAEEGWGRIPVWGFADVIDSAHPEVKTGERFFGYWPMSRYAVLTPSKVDDSTLVEGASQRQSLNPFYNRYLRTSADPAYQADQEDWHSLFRPLGLTGFLLDEFVAENDAWGADTVILSSASSKTAYSLAHFLKERGGCEVVGLTSPGNITFVEELGFYDYVVSYSDIESLQNSSAVFVDMAGDAAVLQRIHEHFASTLKQSVTVGGTHWTELAPPPSLPGPTPEFFFAPTHIENRLKSWGAVEFHTRFARAWASLLPQVQRHVSLVHGQGADSVEDCYRAMLDGTASADKGYILKF